MAKFRLIQRGTFDESKEIANTLIDFNEGVVNLAYMGSSEFEFGAIPKAYRRLMYHFSDYEFFHTEIYTPENEELMLFCKKDYATEVIQAIKNFINEPYSLIENSELEKVPKAKKEDTSYHHRRSNFWWCIDITSCGDWMAFLQPQSKLFIEAINNDYQNWWLKKTPEERESEYKKSLSW